jgi:hypothetical protein
LPFFFDFANLDTHRIKRMNQIEAELLSASLCLYNLLSDHRHILCDFGE